MDNALALHLFVPVFDAPLKPSVIFLLSSCFSCPSEQGIRGLDSRTGLPSLQLVLCPSRFCMV